MKRAANSALSSAAGRVMAVAYYLAVLTGLLLLYGRGEVPTTGFIYQAF